VTDEPAELTEAERRRRRTAVFGDVLPDATSDDLADASEHRPGTDRGSASGDQGDAADAADEWLRREVPPHHG
jgi:hypothetical protein